MPLQRANSLKHSPPLTNPPMAPAENPFSYYVGALALFSTVSSGLLYCRLYLPTSQLRILDELLEETRNIHRKTGSEGLLSHEASNYAQTHLNLYDEETDRLREVAYNALTIKDTLRTLFRGQPRKIMRLAREVKKLRAFLMTTSQMEKARLAERRRQSQAHLHSEQNAYSEITASDSIHGEVAGVDRFADGQILSSTLHPSPPNEPFSALSPPEWPTHASSIADSSVPSTLSRTSTQVDEPAEHQWSLLNSRVSVYVRSFFDHWANTARLPSLDNASHPCRDSATTTPV